ncbi:MAG: hypothetical protein FJX77_08430 [Armatimonadetes bacterium]|nr:hypothetical protein [Armatimonadota bacterium]
MPGPTRLGDAQDWGNFPFDKSARFGIRRDARGVIAWLLPLETARYAFVEWMDARARPFPGRPELVCDTWRSCSVTAIPILVSCFAWKCRANWRNGT